MFPLAAMLALILGCEQQQETAERDVQPASSSRSSVSLYPLSAPRPGATGPGTANGPAATFGASTYGDDFASSEYYGPSSSSGAFCPPEGCPPDSPAGGAYYASSQTVPVPVQPSPAGQPVSSAARMRSPYDPLFSTYGNRYGYNNPVPVSASYATNSIETAPITYSAPETTYAATTYSAPATTYATTTYSAPETTYAATTYSAPAATYATTTYSAPVTTYAASTTTYSAPATTTSSYSATTSYSEPVYTTTYAAPTTYAATTYSAPAVTTTTTSYVPATSYSGARYSNYSYDDYANAGYDMSRVGMSAMTTVPARAPVTTSYTTTTPSYTTAAPVATSYSTTSYSTAAAPVTTSYAVTTAPVTTSYATTSYSTTATTMPAPAYSALAAGSASFPVDSQPSNYTISRGAYQLVPAPDVPPGVHPSDAAPSQWFEIIRPGNGPIRIGRVSSTCVCVGVRVPNRFIGAGERALIEIRTMTRPPVRNVTYGVYVNIQEPDKLVLDADFTVR